MAMESRSSWRRKGGKRKEEDIGAATLVRPALEKFGHLLNADQKEKLRQAAGPLQAAADALRAFELRNADEPATTFAVADRQD